LDHYDTISAISVRWNSGDTGSLDDSSLFIKTILQLSNTETTVNARERVLVEDVDTSPLPFIIDMFAEGQKMAGKRRLFIVHYAGHTVTASNGLILTSRISEEIDDGDRTQFNMTYVRDSLRQLALNFCGLDVLILLDCCCVAVAGRGQGIKGERVELMAAASACRYHGSSGTPHILHPAACSCIFTRNARTPTSLLYYDRLTVVSKVTSLEFRQKLTQNYNLEITEMAPGKKFENERKNYMCL
jgi:hypothetical protein